MKDYKEFTFGWLIFAFVIPIHLLLTYLYINKLGDRPIDTNGYMAITLAFILVYIMFYGMTTKVTLDSISVSFGIGLIKKRTPLSRIKKVDAVRTPWYYGWGIRIIPDGMLYNISGTDGVELRFSDTDRTLRIGSKDSSALKKEIEKRLREG